MGHSDKSVSPTGTLPLSHAFTALMALSDQRFITGLDGWRHETGEQSLASFDPALAAIVQKQPPSKFGHAEKPSLWAATHFQLALPTLSYVIRQYGKVDETTRNIVIPEADLERYFVALPYILRHYREYQRLVNTYGEPTREWWDTTLDTAFTSISNRTSTELALRALPADLEEAARLVLAGKADSLTGRIVLARLLGQGTAPESIGIDKRTAGFLSPIGNVPAKTLYERLIEAQGSLHELEPHLATYDPGVGIRLEDMLDILSWYGRPHLVEMMMPNLHGAATSTFRTLTALFQHLVDSGAPDYRSAPVAALPSAQRFRESQSLESIGRLSLVKDIVGHTDPSRPSEGTVLRQLGIDLFSEAERYKAWGNPNYYVPDSRSKQRPFSTFRQDIGNILYAAGLYTASDNMAGTTDPEALKRLAEQVVQTSSMRQLRGVISDNTQLLNNLAIDWEVRYIGTERLRLLHFVRQTFGLETIKPIPIPLTELNKGFAGSFVDGDTYHVRYREAGERLELAIPLRQTSRRTARVRYCTDPTSHRLSIDGLPYSAWLEVTTTPTQPPVILPVPGRGSFDPFGTSSSPHAGEVIGFGCSVHHASLLIMLAELASLGANAADLRRLTESFMRINRKMHERTDLAALQLAQVLAAFEEDRVLTYADYVRSRPDLTSDHRRPQLAVYIHGGMKPVAWAQPQAARLAYGYPDLYPFSGGEQINPRRSWYDGRPAFLPASRMQWQVIRS